MNKLVKVFLGLGVAAASMLAQAGVVYSAGALSREEGGAIIHDSLNSREWLGWDVVRDWTYAETVAAISQNGAYAGFHIAHTDDVQAFANALLVNKQCDVRSGYISHCSRMPGTEWERIAGESLWAPMYGWVNGNYVMINDEDDIKFLNDSGGAGLFSVFTYYANNSQVMQVGTNWVGPSDWDRFSHNSGSYAQISFGWLLYRDTISTPVPEPSSASLLGAALLGWLGVRRRVKTGG